MKVSKYVEEYFGGVTVGGRTLKRINAALNGEKLTLSVFEAQSVAAIKRNMKYDKK